jgi:hypothetical protein
MQIAKNRQVRRGLLVSTSQPFGSISWTGTGLPSPFCGEFRTLRSSGLARSCPLKKFEVNKLPFYYCSAPFTSRPQSKPASVRHQKFPRGPYLFPKTPPAVPCCSSRIWYRSAGVSPALRLCRSLLPFAFAVRLCSRLRSSHRCAQCSRAPLVLLRTSPRGSRTSRLIAVAKYS